MKVSAGDCAQCGVTCVVARDFVLSLTIHYLSDGNPRFSNRLNIFKVVCTYLYVMNVRLTGFRNFMQTTQFNQRQKFNKKVNVTQKREIMMMFNRGESIVLEV
jgi:hypothetical protein